MSWLFLLLATVWQVDPAAETAPSPYPGDSVDDIAVWIHPDDPEQSLIIATLKFSNQEPIKPTGLISYNLDGTQHEVMYLDTPNNIDIRSGFNQQGEAIALIAVSHWWHNRVDLLTIDATTRRLVRLTPSGIDAGLKDVRGVCLYRGKNDQWYYFVSNIHGEIRQFRINPDLSADLVRSFNVESITEGCVADDANHTLYLSEEEVGIWRFGAEPDDASASLVFKLGLFDPLRADLEGITLYHRDDNTGYLIVSSQGNDRFAIFDRQSNDYLGIFEIISTGEIDGTSTSDGITAVSTPLGTAFPQGVFIAHDDENTEPDGSPAKQNFKLVDWRQIERLLKTIEHD